MAAEDAARAAPSGALRCCGAPLSPSGCCCSPVRLHPAPRPARLARLSAEETGAELSVEDGVLKATEGTRFMLRVYYSTSPQRLNRTAATRANNAAPWIAFIEEPTPGREGQVHPKRNMCMDKNARTSDIEVLGSFKSASSQNSVLVELLAKDLRRGEKIKYYSMCAFDGSKWEHYRTGTSGWPWWSARPSRTLAAGSGLGAAARAVRSVQRPEPEPAGAGPVELQVLQNSGTDKEQNYARKIESVRRHGNYVLCTLLLGTAIINASLAVWMCQILGMTWLSTVICAFGIFFIGEILPHSVASRHGLAIAKLQTAGLILNQEISNFYTREKLLEMLRVTDPYHDLVKEELNIIQGALELRTKTVEDVLTPLTDCFMLASDVVLDFNTMSEIMQSGYTRIPVFENERSNIVDILFVKDLAFVDPDDCTPLKTSPSSTNTRCTASSTTPNWTPCWRSQERCSQTSEGDTYSSFCCGGAAECLTQDFSIFKLSENEMKVKISPQLLLATHRFLSTEVEPFKPAHISEKILLRLIKHPSVVQELKFDEKNKRAPQHFLFQRNKPVDYFILVLQGRVEVEFGKEALKCHLTAGIRPEQPHLRPLFRTHLHPPSHPPLPARLLVHRSPSRSSGLDRSDSMLYGGSMGQLNGAGNVYLPDYSVRQLTHLQIIKNAVTATRMDSSPQTPDADARLTEGNTPTPEPPTTEHTATLMPPPHHTTTTTTTLMPPPRELGGPARQEPTDSSRASHTAPRSKSDGQKSPSDSVFLRMDEIPYIREDRSEADTHTDMASVPIETDTSPFISSLSLSGSEDTLGKKLLLKLSHKKRKKSREGEKTPEDISEQPWLKPSRVCVCVCVCVCGCVKRT
ncbi:hypothetical protein INR49_018498 [Caranx melampygus]|nr:hypothetical protein INR49_018498 [Caranx melampygus]